MKQVTINLPDFSDWRTTIFGIISSSGYAMAAYYQGGGISWKEAAMCAGWACLCYLVPDAANLRNTSCKVDALHIVSRAEQVIEKDKKI